MLSKKTNPFDVVIFAANRATPQSLDNIWRNLSYSLLLLIKFGFYRSRPASRRQRTDMVVLAHIKEQLRLSLGSYRRPRMTEELKEIGLDVGHRRIGRLMRQNGFVVVRTRKHKVTTDSNHTFNIAPNLLDRDFTADRPNQKWEGNISYI